MLKVGLKSSVGVLSSGGEVYERLRSGSSLGLLRAKGFDRREEHKVSSPWKLPKTV